MFNVYRQNAFERDAEDASRYFSPRPGRRVRIIREPVVSGIDVLAFVTILVTVCGPLALRAFAE